jgi:hypothetical protein
MTLRTAAIVLTGLGLLGTVVGTILLVTVAPGFPLVVMAQPVLLVAAALWLAWFIERKRGSGSGDSGGGG